MEYTKRYNELSLIFNPDIKEIKIPGSDIRIVNTEFTSVSLSDGFINKNDVSIKENITFSYPVFKPANSNSRKVILLLHGLNERNWSKYLVWALYLSASTDSYVVLFPISFHINRSPASWIDPRAMLGFLKTRRNMYGEINMSSFANTALSNRLTEDPLRFFNSGYQTVGDLTGLVNSIKNGEHNVIPAGCKINIFAYSIGAFLAQIILMGNPENLFSDSRLFMFCGGSVFSNMHGTSKLIMDSIAYDKVYRYYMEDFEKKITGKSPFVEFLSSSNVGMAFRSMIDFGRFRIFRENTLASLRKRVHSIALSKDTVIPAYGIVETLKPHVSEESNPVEVWDFPYPYSHENPFPVFGNPLSREVDLAFDRLFSEASLFLA